MDSSRTLPPPCNPRGLWMIPYGSRDKSNLNRLALFFSSFRCRNMNDVLFQSLHLIDIDLTRGCCEFAFAHAVWQVLEFQVHNIRNSFRDYSTLVLAKESKAKTDID